jgi:hypothetical protein
MLVVHVGHVPVGVLQPTVLVRMGMRFAERIVRTVFVLVMRVMHMRVRVREHLVLVFMLVILGEMQPHPNSHEPASDEKTGGHRFAQADDCRHRAQKGGCGEISAGAGGAEVAERQHEQCEANAIAEETDDARDKG